MRRALVERRGDPAWRAAGACRRADPDLFFPAPNEPAVAALAVCRACPVQGSCLAWALDVGDCHGVWGGTTPKERRAMGVIWPGRCRATDDGPPVRDLLLTLAPPPPARTPAGA
ncbi:hypothetical protein GCM10010123_34020 [Pilimelia anulata]|uniref:Transcriptional regulator WhiB n=1 Tax=Pilimelia anulata TaxID=53371 RepID=A0A8J3BB86_9ACTN|nr:hypothetical protein GCM10010123_34020 [Pilimelia anulata]